MKVLRCILIVFLKDTFEILALHFQIQLSCAELLEAIVSTMRLP